MKINLMNIGVNSNIFQPGNMKRHENKDQISLAGEIVNKRLEQKNEILTISKEGMERLQVRVLKEAKEIEKNIAEKQEKLESQVKIMNGVKESINDIVKELTLINEKTKELNDSKNPNEPNNPNDVKLSDELKDSIEKTIEDIQKIEEEKAKRENTEYNPEMGPSSEIKDSFAKKDIAGMLKGFHNATLFFEKEIARLLDEIGKLGKRMDKLLGATGKAMEKNEVLIKKNEAVVENLKEVNSEKNSTTKM